MDWSFATLAAILSISAFLGIVEGMMLHPVFYSNAAIIFGILGYISFRYIRDGR